MIKSIKWCTLFAMLLVINTAFAGSGSKPSYKHCRSYATGKYYHEKDVGLELVQQCLYDNYNERIRQEQNCKQNWYCSQLMTKESQIDFFTLIASITGFIVSSLFGWAHGVSEGIRESKS